LKIAADPQSIEQAIEILKAAKRPLILPFALKLRCLSDS
jgi:hypothetical protein